MFIFNAVLANILVMCLSVVQLNALGENQKFNRLNWIEVTQNNVSMQVMFDFKEPIHFKKEVIKDKSQLVLSFPGINRGEFDMAKVKREIYKLKEFGILNDVEVKEDNGNIPTMKLVLTFSPLRAVKNEQDVISNVKNQLTIKWSVVDNQKPHEPSYRLVLDIFTKEVLDSIEQQTSILLQAQNGAADFLAKKKVLA